ncbi:General transcription factor IIH subunit 3 [Homalodisca vitripennis]|nr:General transcription factor IIH subunit 3 [Homalodisca vitripennis]
MLACNAESSEFVFPDENASVVTCRQQDGQYELFTHTERTIRQGLQRFVLDSTRHTHTQTLVAESLLAGAFTMALCYIHRLERELAAGIKMNSRILVVTGSGDSASQYMNYMNVFFTAQKHLMFVIVLTTEVSRSRRRKMAGLRSSEIDRIINEDGVLLSDSDSDFVPSDIDLDDIVLKDQVELSADEFNFENEEFDQVDLGINNNLDDIIENVAVGSLGLEAPNDYLDLAEPYIWEDESNEPFNILFCSPNVGVNIENPEELESEIDCFSHFAGDDLFDMIAMETNRYAQQQFADVSRKQLKSDNKWTDCTPNEIKTFFTLCIIMSIVKNQISRPLGRPEK